MANNQVPHMNQPTGLKRELTDDSDSDEMTGSDVVQIPARKKNKITYIEVQETKKDLILVSSSDIS